MKHALADRSERSGELVASGRQIDMIFKPGQKALSLRAQKLWHLLVKAAGVKLPSNTTHSIPLAGLYQTGLGHMTLAERVDTLRELQTTLVEVRVPSVKAKGRMRVISGPLLDYVARDEDDRGDLEWSFSRVLRTVFADSEHWAVLSQRAVMALESRYSLRLYELVALRAGLDHKTSETFPLEELRSRLGVPVGKLPLWADVRRVVLEPAISEVNHLAGFLIRYEPIKKGRAVAAVRLIWEVKAASDRKATKRELDAPRVGRKARRDGTVETATPSAALPAPGLGPFPAAGSITYIAWGDVARQELPQPRRDLDLVAGEFRQWCRAKPLPLDARNIEKIFRTFCKGVKPAA